MPRPLPTFAAALAPALALAGAPRAQDLVAALEGPPDSALLEPHVAATAESAMVVAIQDVDNQVGQTQPLRYGVIRRAGGAWAGDFTEGTIPLTLDPSSPLAVDGYAIEALTDPTVAAHAGERGYLCVALASLAKGGAGPRCAVVRSHYDLAAAAWGPWRELEWLPGAGKLDKPVVVAGAAHEFYVVWWHPIGHPQPGRYSYRRSTDGGRTWVGGLVRDSTDQPDAPPAVGGLFAMQPSAHGDTPLYLAYTKANTPVVRTRLLMGLDQPDGTVRFERLRDRAGADLEVLQSTFYEQIPLPGKGPQPRHIETRGIAQVAVDPRAIRELYVAFHDRDGTEDVDCHVVPVRWRDGAWALGPRTTLPDPPGAPPDRHTDQWLPMITVDTNGTVHVVYYDDLEFAQTAADAHARYDVAYGVSDDRGRTFTVRRFPPRGGDLASLDTHLLLDGPNGERLPREYNGLAFAPRGDGTADVWAAFCGTAAADGPRTSVIWSFRQATR